ncbi:hypothetical protein KFE25_001249 [Diacronema lutheri]|uniref:RNA-binding S4 domain-containing protein n=1 Tax=Diacronema lutheri TaxID=2081491 RepID=A0A8J6C862_DIALT|nr:hypothetical protein KFE25_001249 [Diacronema lutheri]
MALVRLRVEPLRPTATLQRALSDVPLHPSESRILRQIREAKEGAPLAHVPGSPFGGDVVVKRIDRFGRRRIRGKRGMSKRVIWVKQVAKHFYHNLSTKKLHRTVRTAIRAKQGFAQALYFQLESRLDMFMRRCFFAPSLAAARQAISHKFVLVNGRLAVSASHQLNYGDVVQVDEKAQAKMRRALLVAARTPRLESGWKSGQSRYDRYLRLPFWGMPQQQDWEDMYGRFKDAHVPGGPTRGARGGQGGAGRDRGAGGRRVRAPAE